MTTESLYDRKTKTPRAPTLRHPRTFSLSDDEMAQIDCLREAMHAPTRTSVVRIAISSIYNLFVSSQDGGTDEV